jgi:hypothetical protein
VEYVKSLFWNSHGKIQNTSDAMAGTLANIRRGIPPEKKKRKKASFVSTVRSESRCALRLRYVDLVVSVS